MRWSIVQNGSTWHVVRPDGTVDSAGHASYQAALAHLPRTSFALHLAEAETPPAEGDDAGEEADEQQAGRRWTSRAAFLNQWTGDGRRLTGSPRFRPGPMPLMWQTETEMGHFGAELVGWIDVTEVDGETITLGGGWDDNDLAEQAIAVTEARGSFGVSIDVGDVEQVEELCVGVNEDNECNSWGLDFLNPEVIGLTGTPFPAFQNAVLWMADATAPAALPAAPQPEVVEDAEDPEPSILLLASAGAPERPPADWFADPGIGDVTHPLMTFSDEGCPLGVPLQVDDDGRVYGHLAAWSTCHIGLPNCTTAPGSPSAYAYFRTGYVVAEDGQQVPTGVITMGTGHADLAASAREATAHYDDATYGIADVAAGEDAVGIWVAGSLRPGATADQVRALRALSLSGDWRSIGGNLELVAALAVNVPGFPIPRSLAASANVVVLPTERAQARVAAGATVALVASGIVARRSDPSEAILRRLSEVERRLTDRLDAIDARTSPLVASAKQAIIDRVRG